VYQSHLIAKFINKLMLGGKKAVARKIVYQALEGFVARIKGDDPLKAFEIAIDNAKPSLEVKTRRIGGTNYQVPIEIAPDRRVAMAMQWIIQFSRKKPGQSMKEALTSELSACYTNEPCATIKKKEDTHRMAEANRAFSHYSRF
jgi:small subunit ribosomal protein S7